MKILSVVDNGEPNPSIKSQFSVLRSQHLRSRCISGVFVRSMPQLEPPQGCWQLQYTFKTIISKLNYCVFY